MPEIKKSLSNVVQNNGTFLKTMKSATKSKKTNIPTQKEQQIKHTFKPKFSLRDGSARLSFTGVEHSYSEKTNKPFLKIVFTCMDETGKKPQNISILSNYNYNESNNLGRTLTKLHFEAPESTVTITNPDDEWGYEVEYPDLTTPIYEHLQSCKGLVYKSKLTQDNRGFYRIEIDSLMPLMNGDEQLRDAESNVEFQVHNEYDISE